MAASSLEILITAKENASEALAKLREGTESESKSLTAMQLELAKAEQAAQRLEQRATATGSAIHKLEADVAAEKVASLRTQMDSAGGSTSKLGSAFGALIPVLGAAVAGFSALSIIHGAVEATEKWADELYTLREQTGLSEESVSGLAVSAEHYGLSVDDVTNGLGKFAKNITTAWDATQKAHTASLDKMEKAQEELTSRTADLNKQYARSHDDATRAVNDAAHALQLLNAKHDTTAAGQEAMRAATERLNVAQMNLKRVEEDHTEALGKLDTKFQDTTDALSNMDPKASAAVTALAKLGLKVQDVTDASGNLTENGLRRIMDGFAGLDDSTTKSAVIMAIFGKSGRDLLEFMSQGSKGLDDMTGMANKLGLAMSGNNLEDAHKYSLAQNDLGLALKGIQVTIGTELMNSLTRMALWFTDNQPKIRGWIVDVIDYMKDKLAGLGKVADDAIHGDWSKAWQDLKVVITPIIDDAWQQIHDHVLPILNQAGKDFAKALVDGFLSYLTSQAQNLADKISSTLGLNTSTHGNSTFSGGNTPVGYVAGNNPAAIAAAGGAITMSHAAGNYYARSPQLAWIGDSPGGEYVLTPQQVTRLASGGGSDGAMIVIQGPLVAIDKANLADGQTYTDVAQRLMGALRSQGLAVA